MSFLYCQVPVLVSGHMLLRSLGLIGFSDVSSHWFEWLRDIMKINLAERGLAMGEPFAVYLTSETVVTLMESLLLL